MKIKRLGRDAKSTKIMRELGVDGSGVKIMAKKAEVMLFYITNMHVGAANILKQDALSVGADLAIPNGTITCAFKRVDALLIGTKKHIEILAKKELAQPYGLKELAKELRTYLKREEFAPKIMGIINATEDSFYPKSRFSPKEAIAAIEQMVSEGADIIDIGGMSTRPGSEEISEEEELKRVAPIIDTLAKKTFGVRLSIDTYRPKVARYALERGFDILNDITGLENDELAKIAAEYGAGVVIMHKKGNPKTMQQNPQYTDVVAQVSDFFKKRIYKAKAFGVQEIILDPGIGFGKRLEDNLLLLRDLVEYKKFGYEILVGASRKSMIDKIIPTPVQERLPGTLSLHQLALQNGATILRCHDVAAHKQLIEIYKAYERV